ncbi:MAG: PPK2 family polyphosphate kinase [Planctomycetota bacterium]
MTQSLAAQMLVKPGSSVDIDALDAEATYGVKRKAAEIALAENQDRIKSLQYRLFAERSRSLLVILQARDAAGKDGAIRHVFSGVNPQGVQVTGFASPSTRERSHDYLWRAHKRCPEHGIIGVFNRSYYEDVLIVRVNELVSKSTWRKRYDHIRNFERMMTDEGTVIIKICLNVSKEQQHRRLLRRIHDPDRNWKFSEEDFIKRRLWDKYSEAYNDAIEETAADHAPWYIVPADHKWFRNHVIASIVADRLEKMDPKPPRLKLSEEEMARLAV